jgi:hypothetical protein
MQAAAMRRVIVRGASLAAGAVALVAGYDAGQRMGGALLGAIMAVNAAVFAALVVGALAERLWREAPEDEPGKRT